MRLLIFPFLLILISTISFGQEICDNGIDDDGDGLVDLLDDECPYYSVMPTSDTGLVANWGMEHTSYCQTAAYQYFDPLQIDDWPVPVDQANKGSIDIYDANCP
ncbi:MAG: hypothetical protein HRT71_04310, partial [Flavobacteriales bacterium]|nr:hypothetical protein [Flavobacteriales bacterium]